MPRSPLILPPLLLLAAGCAREAGPREEPLGDLLKTDTLVVGSPEPKPVAVVGEADGRLVMPIGAPALVRIAAVRGGRESPVLDHESRGREILTVDPRAGRAGVTLGGDPLLGRLPPADAYAVYLLPPGAADPPEAETEDEPETAD